MAGAATVAPKAAVCLDPTVLATPATTFWRCLRLPARSPAPAGGLRLRAAPAKAGAEEIVLQPIREISGAMQLPGSKSLSNRILLLSALSEGTTVVDNLLNSEDVHYMLEALKALGLSVEADGGEELREEEYQRRNPLVSSDYML